MIIILFHLNEICERGTSVAVYDYAHYNETLLENKSIIVTQKNSQHHDGTVDRFNNRFKVYFYNSHNELIDIITNENVDIFYAIKYGFDDKLYPPKNVKHIVHCVFDTTNYHGDVCASISEHLNIMCNTNIPVVPHIVSLPQCECNENLRSTLNIPENATVFGRYGGYEQFDIIDVHKAIVRIVNENENIYFLFANTYPFYYHERIIYLETITDPIEKVKFINTTDAMIHARSEGETFGLACGEFSVCNKPIITCLNMGAQAHISILRERGLYYTDKESCYKILKKFDRNETKLKNWNSYTEYTPEKVMEIFKKIFIDQKIYFNSTPLN